jgi:SAM-dependent methyltransferase
VISASSSLDVWFKGDAYEAYMGRWSRLVARQFLAWLSVSPDKAWLDVGCGTGALSQSILELAGPRELKAIDQSAGYIEHLRLLIDDARAQFEVGDAQALPVESSTYNVVVSGLMLNFVLQPQQVISEMARAARREGVIAVYVWDYAGEMQMLRRFWDAAAALDPAAIDLDEGRRFPICQPQPLRKLFENAGLRDVIVQSIDIVTNFRDFDDYWAPFLGGQGPAPGYVASLNEEHRVTLRDRIRDELPIAADGSISLMARAWAVRGTRTPIEIGG